MSQCKIHLENYNGTYYPGTEIRGRVECYFSSQTTFRGIKIKLKCKEQNQWTATESYEDPETHQKKTRHITLTGDHDVISLEQTLVGLESGSHVLNYGRHVFPFQFFLPTDIPSSYTGPHGSITFYIKAVVDRPMAFDYEDEITFAVVSPIDFNHMPKELQNPSSYSDEKTVCCWCCQGGNITMDVELPKTTFLAGEIIPLKVRVSNLSNSTVERIQVKFMMSIKYKVTHPRSETRENKDEILSHRENGVGAHGEHTFNMQLLIPQHIVVPNFTRCHLFNVSYLMTVSCVMPSCTLDMDVEIPDIKLGHVQWSGGQTEGGAFGTNSHSTLPPIDGFYPPPNAAPVSPQQPPFSSGPSPMGFGGPPLPPTAAPVSPALPPYPSGPSPMGFEGPPPTAAPAYPPYSSPMGFVGQPSAPPTFGGDQQQYPPPPGSYNPGFAKAQETAGQPSAPMPPPTQPPPPSYNNVQQSSNNYYPPR